MAALALIPTPTLYDQVADVCQQQLQDRQADIDRLRFGSVMIHITVHQGQVGHCSVGVTERKRIRRPNRG